jgi:aconitate hydratase
MIKIIANGVYLYNNTVIIENNEYLTPDQFDNNLKAANQPSISSKELLEPEVARKNTISHKILTVHNVADDPKQLRLKFDSLTSHDLTYVGIIQTAKASGLEEFPIPYVLTNCHNSLCAVGGTINEDDHLFGLSAAKKYGGIFVPAHQAVIHQYIREMMSSCGSMILGSDSHTRYGALGTMGVGEGGPELVKQLLGNTYDIAKPDVIAVYLSGSPQRGIGPQDVALAIIGAVFQNGFVKNKVLEFVGPGIANLSIDYRNGIDVMTTETTCLSSIWCTDEKVREYYSVQGRPEAYRKLKPGEIAYYDGMITVELDKIEAMIALPFHPSNVFTIKELNEKAAEILAAVEEDCQKQIDNPKIKIRLRDKIINGRIKVEQAAVAGCAGGTFANLCEMAAILDGHPVANDYFALSVYPASQPIYFELIQNGMAAKLMQSGALMKTAFCGPCFGAGDTPANNALSIRHTTRNFPNREGSKPGEGQIAAVALMDARSIAATAVNGGYLIPATEIEIPECSLNYSFNGNIYKNSIYNGYSRPEKDIELKFGPNIADWPALIPLTEHLVLKIASVIPDPVTTTDELIPSGENASLRSNPLRMAELTLSRRDPAYVGRAKDLQVMEKNRQEYLAKGDMEAVSLKLKQEAQRIMKNCGYPFGGLEEFLQTTGFGSVIYAVKPGDGSAREQAVSCQRVLGGLANIAVEYATKRYRSNLVNWGILPFTVDFKLQELFTPDDYIFIPNIRQQVENGAAGVSAKLIGREMVQEIELRLNNLSKEEAEIILQGSLINYYASKRIRE